MAAQDVRTLVPRVRRAMEGPVISAQKLTDDECLTVAADSIADIILLTVGAWGRQLLVTHRTVGGVPDEWSVDDELLPEEESMIAAQAAISYLYHALRDQKTMENILNEGAQWQWEKSPNLMIAQLKGLQDMRDQALKALMQKHPVLAQYASILEVRDRLGAALIEPWISGAFRGGQELFLYP